MPSAADCTSSVVVNISNQSRPFPFLPPHGRTLAAGGKLTLPGDIFAILSPNKRKFRALQYCLDNNLLAIEKTPSPRFFDEVTDMTKILQVSNNSVSAADPCEGAYSSSIG